MIYQHIPYSHNMAHRPHQHKEMENTVHIASLVQTIEGGSGYVAYSFGYNPRYGGWAYGINLRNLVNIS